MFNAQLMLLLWIYVIRASIISCYTSSSPSSKQLMMRNVQFGSTLNHLIEPASPYRGITPILAYPLLLYFINLHKRNRISSITCKCTEILYTPLKLAQQLKEMDFDRSSQILV